MSFTIGSLFDGSGGFPLAASLCGGTPKWASEIEPYPIAVTKSRFPNVKHLGSVTDIKGGEVEPVDVITFGSPCQDLSVAGKRAGLKHEANGDDETTRSGLFMEAVRIIKEMREATNGVYPRFAVWENVPGAFSSNKGEDFRIVLEELIKVVEPSAVMPSVPEKGWPYADNYCGDGWSIAYRVFDAQYWGVPQRRRRIYLVADFRGECAGAVSSQQPGLRGHFETGRTPWQTVTGDAETGSGAADCERDCVGADIYNLAITGDIVCSLTAGGYGSTGTSPKVIIPAMTVLDDQGGSQISVRDDGKCPTLRAEMHGNVPSVMEPVAFDVYNQAVTGDVTKSLTAIKSDADHVPVAVYSVENHPADSRVNLDESGKVQCLTSRMGTGGGNVPMVMEPIPIHDQATRFSGKHGDKSDGKGNGLGVGNPGDPMNTLTAGDRHAVAFWDGGQTVATLTANNAGGNQRMPDKENFNCVIETRVVSNDEEPVVLDRAFFNQGQNAKFDPAIYQDGTVPTLVARGPAAVAVRYIVRRLTPTECARLQGFPDTWGHPIEKTEFTDEEYQFWLNVRNTNAAINDKATKEYTKEQMLKWYNGLHTDSSEYKMWGNGIALPNALYVMQGIADVMSEEKAARRKWLTDLLGDCL